MSRAAGRRVASAVAVLAVVAALVVVAGSATGRLRTAAVLSGSMAPYAPAGSAVVTTPVRTSALRPGDVVTLRAPAPWGGLVTHRVVSAQPRSDGAVVLVTKGDRNEDVDPWQAVVREPHVARVAVVVPHAGTVLAAASGDGAERTRDTAVWLLALGWLVRSWRPGRTVAAVRGCTPFFDLSALPGR